MTTLFSDSLQAFLATCALSSNDTISAFEHVLACLQQPLQAPAARQLLVQLQQAHQSGANAEFLEKYHFSFIRIDLGNQRDHAEPMVLLQFPSTFTPEEWSYTFFEGLSRYELSQFGNKNLVELGCGNGWISIGLAKRYQTRRIVGLDINPRAIIASRINLQLNAIDAQGQLLLDDEGLSLLDKVEFHESDLLGYFKGQHALFDAIVGCIPQVLSPSDDMFDEIISKNQDDEFLYSLSNYCGKQGYIEDQFGLGLIARAIEESIDLLKPNGKIIFNLGGRPGAQVLERLVQRRGLTVQKIWQRRVVQAQDTDIDALVEIENKSLHRFEFFLGLNSDEPVSAKTAQAFLQQGGKIAHALSVYEFTIPQHRDIANIFQLLQEPDYKNALSGLDLAYASKEEAEEKIHFLSNLSLILKQTDFFPYADTAGQRLLRQRLAQFFDSYFYTSFSQDQFVVAPGRLSLVNNLLHIYQPKVVLVDREFARMAEIDQALTHCDIIEAPNSSHELCTLIEAIRPQLVLVAVNPNQVAQVDPFARVVAACDKVQARLVLDISRHLELSSNPGKIGALGFAAEYGLPSHCAIICGLTNNQVYHDLELAIFIAQDEAMLSALVASAEFTYSRAPLLTQLYYSELIFELLKFQMTNMRAINKPLPPQSQPLQGFIAPQAHVLEAFAHPAIKGNTLPISASTVRLDYGENEFASSSFVKAGIFESFVRQHLTGAEIDPRPEIRTLLAQRFGMQQGGDIFFGNGVAPLFAAIVKACKAQGGTLLFPQGAYGYFYAAARFYDVPVKVIPTHQADSFKLSAAAIDAALHGVSNPCLFLNFPLVNPTGACYQPEEAHTLLAQLARSQVHLIIDTVFSGLEFADVQAMDLQPHIQAGLAYTLIGGISKEFSAGGLRFGFAISRDAGMIDALCHSPIDQPHSTLRYCAKQLYQLLIERNPAMLAQLRTQQQRLLARYQRLSQVLLDLGWQVLPPQGGLFLVACPIKYLGRSLTIAGVDYVLSSSNINEALYYSVGLLINNDVWTGIPGYCRLVLSVEDATFEQGLRKLQAFDALLAGPTAIAGG
ncbi:MAG: hypothetical protein RL748_3037 [Pseudomonadota bacterium]|jgi:methionine S-methyltransferase